MCMKLITVHGTLGSFESQKKKKKTGFVKD